MRGQKGTPGRSLHPVLLQDIDDGRAYLRRLGRYAKGEDPISVRLKETKDVIQFWCFESKWIAAVEGYLSGFMFPKE